MDQDFIEEVILNEILRIALNYLTQILMGKGKRKTWVPVTSHQHMMR